MRIKVTGCEPKNVIVQNLIEALFKEYSIELDWKPDSKDLFEIDIYILLYLCHYEIEEKTTLIQAVRHAAQILEKKVLNDKTNLLIILYRDLHVAFPERKLQREKEMSEMASIEILQQEAPLYVNQIHITHEFGTSDVRDSIDFLKGKSFFVEVINIM